MNINVRTEEYQICFIFHGAIRGYVLRLKERDYIYIGTEIMHLNIALIVYLIQCEVTADIRKSGLLFNPHGPIQKHGNMQQLPELWFNPSLSDM